jgi:ABC-2 type transport system ATP-binding protein
MGASDAVRAIGLTKRYGRTIALDGVGIALAAGEIRGLLGPNGAGKTTLLRLLFGLAAADSGSITILGTEIGASDALDAVGGFVEDPGFYPYLSGEANLRLLARLDGATRMGAIGPALARVELDSRAGDRVGGYSTGMRQRLGIAAALIRAPRLLLLDEPTSGLDPAGTRAVAELVRELAAEGVAVLLSSHHIGELERVCHSYTVLSRGRVVWDGTAAELEAQAPASAYTLSTSDDQRVLELAAQAPGVRAGRSPHGELTLAVERGALDPFVLSLGDARIAVRRLELIVSPLESMYFSLTEGVGVENLEPHELAHRVLVGAQQ